MDCFFPVTICFSLTSDSLPQSKVEEDVPLPAFDGEKRSCYIFAHAFLPGAFPLGIGRRIAANSLVILLARLIVAGLNLVFVWLISHYLGKKAFGQYAVISSAFNLATDIPAAGMNLILIRHIAAREQLAPQYLGAAMFLRLIFGGLLGLIATVVVTFLPLAAPVRAAAYVGIVWMFSLLSIYIYVAVLFGFERFYLQAVLNVANMALTIVFAFLILQLNFRWRLAGVIAASALANVIIARLGFTLAFKKMMAPQKPQSRDVYVNLLRQSLPVGVATILLNLYERIDIFLLGHLRGSNEVAIFYAPYRIVQQLIVLPNMIVRPAYPILSRFAREDRTRFRRLLLKLSIAFVLIATIVSSVLYLLSGAIIVRIFGTGFHASIPVLQYLSFLLFVMFPNSLLWFSLLSLGRQVGLTYALACTVVTNFLLDYLLIPSLGAIGACIGTIAGQLAFLLFCCASILFQRKAQPAEESEQLEAPRFPDT